MAALWKLRSCIVHNLCPPCLAQCLKNTQSSVNTLNEDLFITHYMKLSKYHMFPENIYIYYVSMNFLNKQKKMNEGKE